MRLAVLGLGALCVSPAVAQTAVTLDFSQPQAAISGVEVISTPTFTEYRSGMWSPVTERSITPGATPKRSESTFNAVAADDSCLQSALPRYVPGLRRDVAIRRLTWWRAVAATECRYGLPTGLLDALVLHESQYSPTAVSRAGAVGLAQLMPGTAGDLGVSDSLNPVANVDGGGRYLRDMMAKFSSVPLALAAYNAGPGAVRSAGGIPANSETPTYVRRVLGFWSATGADELVTARQMAVRLGFIDPRAD